MMVFSDNPEVLRRINETADQRRPETSPENPDGARRNVYKAPAAIRHFFIPAQLTRLEASGPLPLRQCVSSETAPW